MTYYMAATVFAMRLVNLRFVTCYTDQNFKENTHFGALNRFTSEKKAEIKLQDVYQPWGLRFDFVPQHFKPCVYLWTKGMKKLTRNLIEEDSSQCLKFYCSSQLRRRKSTGRDSRCKRKSNSFDKYDNKHACTRSSWRASLSFVVFFQRPTKER